MSRVRYAVEVRRSADDRLVKRVVLASAARAEEVEEELIDQYEKRGCWVETVEVDEE